MAKYLRYLAHDFDGFEPDALRGNPVTAGFVFDLFQLELGKTPSREIAKLVVVYTPDGSRHLDAEERIDVLVVWFHLDLASLSLLPAEEQKWHFLESIHETLLAHAGTYGWDAAQCTAVRDRISAGGVVFDRSWGKPVRHRASRRSAQWHVVYERDVELSLDVRERDGSERRLRLATLPGTIGAIEHACGRIEWLDENHLRSWQENDRDHWDVDVGTGEVAYHYPRAESGDPHGEYDLAQMYLRGYLVDPDEDRAVHWLRRSAAQGFGRAIRMLERMEVSVE